MEYTLITGACGGLGGAFARVLSQRGTPLYLTGRSEDKLQSLANSLTEKHPSLSVRYFPCDLSDESSRKEFFAHTDEEGIVFSRLIYAAGADIQKAFCKYTEEKLVFQARVNFEGAASFIRAVLLRARLDGSTEILAAGSVSGIYPMPYFALYSAEKRALEQLLSALRIELKGRAKVTCVRLGAMPTRADVIENIKTQGLWGKLAALPPETAAKKSLKAVSRNRRAPVIGFWNKLMRAFTAWTPTAWKLRFIAARWKKTEKDAF